MASLPQSYQQFRAQYSEIWEAYDRLGAAVHSSGPLDEKQRALVKLGMAVALQHEGAVHAHVRKALAAGLTADEIRQTVLLGMPTIGFPATMAALSWAEDMLGD
ncbi:MAG: carboxymuconolactone decarboxylase family protein [Chloroflexi bacterium]|nr:carboxymuconolactone decarboxylase family protein [Chloroflexota bacterium]